MASDPPIYSALRTRPALATLAREFATALPDLAAEIARHADGTDLELVRKLAHRLKGSAGGYGYPDITRAAAELEASAQAGDMANVGRMVRAVVALCDRARAGAADDGGAPR